MSVESRIAHIDWLTVANELDEWGYAKTPALLVPDECNELISMYGCEERFRSRVTMQRFRFGVGEYKYLADPLPPTIQSLRIHAYRRLSPIANRWMEMLGREARYPPNLTAFLAVCAEKGQRRPTPLILRYEADGYNCLHQDLYGDVAFPLQMTIVLNKRDIDFTGGEFLLVENRPRAQSAGSAITLEQGEAVIFPNSERPVRGARGFYRVGIRHGTSRIRSGVRFSLGIIFHNAK